MSVAARTSGPPTNTEPLTNATPWSRFITKLWPCGDNTIALDAAEREFACAGYHGAPTRRSVHRLPFQYNAVRHFLEDFASRDTLRWRASYPNKERGRHQVTMRGDKKQAAPMAGILNAPRIGANGEWHVPHATTAEGWLEAEFSTPQQNRLSSRRYNWLTMPARASLRSATRRQYMLLTPLISLRADPSSPQPPAMRDGSSGKEPIR